MDFTDIIIVILMFAAPVVSAVIDHKKKVSKRASMGSGQHGPRPGEFRPFTSLDPEMPDDEDDESDYFPTPEPQMQVPVHRGFTEGESSISHDHAAPIPEPADDTVEKERINARKLIIYDAIMNPKFKE